MKTKVMYGCVIKNRNSQSFTVIGPLEKTPTKIRETCEALQPDDGFKLYHVAKIEIEVE